VLCIYLLTGSPDKLRLREVELWRRSWGPARPPPKKSSRKKGDLGADAPAGAKRVGFLPADLGVLVDAAGAGRPIGIFELVPRIAYLGVFGPSVTAGADLQAVVGKLAEPAPTFTARPLPIVDGARVANTGVIFNKDPPFTDAYLVEGLDAKAIKRWLNPLVREQLIDMPDVWLSVSGKAMALLLYGTADAEKLDDLVSAADVIFAEYGAEGGPSLLGHDEGLEPEPAPKAAVVTVKVPNKPGKGKPANKFKDA